MPLARIQCSAPKHFNKLFCVVSFKWCKSCLRKQSSLQLVLCLLSTYLPATKMVIVENGDEIFLVFEFRHPSTVSKSFRKIVLNSSIIRQFWQVRNLTDQDLGSIGKIRFEYASFVLRLVSKNNSHLKIAGPKIVIVEVVRHHIVVLREWGVVDWLPLTFWSKRRQYLPKKWGHR